MKRMSLRILIACLTFFIGVACSMVWQFAAQPSPATMSAGEPNVPQPFNPQTLKIVDGLDACGSKSNEHLYELSDGTRISISCETLSSVARAEKEFQKSLSHVTEIIERTPNLDEKGRKVGERVTARKAAGAVALTTYQATFCLTEAPSLAHIQ